MSQTLTIEQRDRLAIVRMNRPERRNAMSVDFMLEITRCAHEIGADPGIDVVILYGGPGWFSAGADLKDNKRWEALGKSLTEAREIAAIGYRMARAWEEMPQVSIAAIEGYAIGGGLALALACDWRVIADNAFVSLPEIGLGLPLTWGTIPRLVALGGPAIAKRLTILCERVSAQEAATMRLIDYVCGAGDALERAQQVAAQVLKQPRAVVRMSKEAANASAYALAHVASYAGADQFTLAAASEESRAARDRFSRG